MAFITPFSPPRPLPWEDLVPVVRVVAVMIETLPRVARPEAWRALGATLAAGG